MSVIAAMCLFSLVMSISPGPVNMITLSIGMNHGLRQAVPFVSGATIGFTLLLLLIGAGLGGIADRIPHFLEVLAYTGALVICYLGYKIAFSTGTIDPRPENAPDFLQGFLLQWLNPKAWAACFAGVSAFSAATSMTTLALFVSIYFLICFFGIGSWAFVGERIVVLISTPARLRVFNLLMGGALVLVAGMLLLQQQGTLLHGNGHQIGILLDQDH